MSCWSENQIKKVRETFPSGHFSVHLTVNMHPYLFQNLALLNHKQTTQGLSFAFDFQSKI